MIGPYCSNGGTSGQRHCAHSTCPDPIRIRRRHRCGFAPDGGLCHGGRRFAPIAPCSRVVIPCSSSAPCSPPPVRCRPRPSRSCGWCTPRSPALGPVDDRLRGVRAEIEATGTYRHTATELQHGARLAWRNSARCTGRLYWRSLGCATGGRSPPPAGWPTSASSTSGPSSTRPPRSTAGTSAPRSARATWPTPTATTCSPSWPSGWGWTPPATARCGRTGVTPVLRLGRPAARLPVRPGTARGAREAGRRARLSAAAGPGRARSSRPPRLAQRRSTAFALGGRDAGGNTVDAVGAAV